jgi:hypothetical protein
MTTRTRLYPFALALLLAGCVSLPEGPSVMVLPGTGKAMEQFRNDDAYCRQLAMQQSGGKSADQASVDSGVRSAAVGTVIGAAAGAVMGGHQGAGVGAGTGLVVGALAGTEAAERSAQGTQQRYDIAYVQCMYESGHRVPVSGRLAVERTHAYPQPPSASAPPKASAPPSPPPPLSPLPAMPPAPVASDRLFVYPKGGQSEAQIAADRITCTNWASTQTGYEPGKSPPSDPRHADFKRATAACLESYGYSVK